MAAALGALGNDGVDAGFFEMLGQHGRRHHGDDKDAGFFPFGHILAGVARAGGDDGDLFLHDDLRKFIGARVHEHDVDAERFVGQLTAAADVRAQFLAAVHAAAADKPQRPGVGAGGRKLAGGDVGHAALDDGVTGAQKFVEQFHTALPFTVISMPPQVSPPPKPMQAMRMPGCRRPLSCSSYSATGMLAALVLPWRSIFL